MCRPGILSINRCTGGAGGFSDCNSVAYVGDKTPADVDETAVQLEEVVRLRAEIVTLRGQVGELELKVEEL
jgi:hypothetical protein